MGYLAVLYGILYKTLFQSVFAYAAHGWARNLTARNKKHFLSAQRQVLIRTTKAFSTSSIICLPVVAGVFPIDLYLSRRVHRYRVRREQPIVIRLVEIVEEMYTDPDGGDEARRLIDEQLVEE
jgi:hypothetical protein